MRIAIVALIVLLMPVGVVVYLLTAQDTNAPAAAVPEAESVRVGALEDELNAARMELERVEAALAEAEKQNDFFERELAAVRRERDADAPAEDATDDDVATARKRSLDEIRTALKNNAGVSAQLKALTELMYADFLNSLDIDPETKAELRQLLADSFMESMALTRFALLEGDVPWSEVRGWELNERAYLDAKIKEMLPPQEYEQWTNYFADIDAKQLEGNLRNQIRAVATGLTPENFEYVLDVAVEEFRAQQATLEQSNQPFTLSENINYQLRAMEVMRERLSQTLDAGQLAEIENWLTMAERLLAAELPDEN